PPVSRTQSARSYGPSGPHARLILPASGHAIDAAAGGVRPHSRLRLSQEPYLSSPLQLSHLSTSTVVRIYARGQPIPHHGPLNVRVPPGSPGCALPRGFRLGSAQHRTQRAEPSTRTLPGFPPQASDRAGMNSPI